MGQWFVVVNEMGPNRAWGVEVATAVLLYPVKS